MYCCGGRFVSNAHSELLQITMLSALLPLAKLLAHVAAFSYQRARTIAAGLCIKDDASASIAATLFNYSSRAIKA